MIIPNNIKGKNKFFLTKEDLLNLKKFLTGINLEIKNIADKRGKFSKLLDAYINLPH